MKNRTNITALTGLKGDAPAISFKPLLAECKKATCYICNGNAPVKGVWNSLPKYYRGEAAWSPVGAEKLQTYSPSPKSCDMASYGGQWRCFFISANGSGISDVAELTHHIRYKEPQLN